MSLYKFYLIWTAMKDYAFLGFHRYGISDYLTGGIRGEASENVINLGLSSTLTYPETIGDRQYFIGME